tara:strand:+ start:4831 stop:5694 length:864 start_codon:yes stop_codon:yes gene_type:complete
MKLIKYIFEFIFFSFLFLFFKLIGLKISSYLSSFLFVNLGPFFRKKKIIIENIKIVFPDLKEIEINKLIKSMWSNYGKIFAEYVFLKKFRNNYDQSYVEIEGLEILNKIKESGKPVIFISGHFNNFELMAMEIEKSGVNLAAIYRPLNNFFLDKIMVYIRKKFICSNQLVKGLSGVRDSFKLFKEGFSLALMIDQRLSEGIKINFFGKIAFTTTLPAQFVKKFNAEIVPVYICRTKNSKFKMKIHKPMVFEKNETIDGITSHLNNWIEKEIIKYPDQWIWSHNRWKI